MHHLCLVVIDAALLFPLSEMKRMQQSRVKKWPVKENPALEGFPGKKKKKKEKNLREALQCRSMKDSAHSLQLLTQPEGELRSASAGPKAAEPSLLFDEITVSYTA